MDKKHNDCVLSSGLPLKKAARFQSIGRFLSFTLLELLVAMSIIGVLVAFLTPALKEVKDRAKTIQCMSNLHQIGIALEAYGNDHDHYPEYGVVECGRCGDDGSWPLMVSKWSFDLSRYLGKEEASKEVGRNSRSPVLECPASKKLESGTLCTYDLYMGIVVFVDSGQVRTYPCRVRPADIIVMADGCQRGVVPGSSFYPNGEAEGFFQTIPTSWSCSGRPEDIDKPVDVGKNMDDYADNIWIRFRHRDNTLANLLFVDGHVASLKTNQVLQRNVIMGYDLKSW